MIKLKVLSYKGLPLSSELTAEFDHHGGTIGRKQGNTLVLADTENFVSGHHAEVVSQDGQYYIKDTSKNGTYLVNAGINLNNSQATLQANEILRIGEYELLVEVLNDAGIEPINLENLFISPFTGILAEEGDSILSGPIGNSEVNNPFVSPFPDRPPVSPFHDSFIPPSSSLSEENGGKDIAELLKGLDSLVPATPVADKPITPSIQIPEIGEGDIKLPFGEPEEAAGLSSEFVRLENEFSPEPRSGKLAGEIYQEKFASNAIEDSNELMRLFLDGAGIKDHAFLPAEQRAEAMRGAGALFRGLIEGLMDVLRARAEMKSEFRVSVTTIRSFDNNPLKFNPDLESVLKLMLSPNNPAFIKPNDAVNEAFKDIKYHQLAMTAGIQASLAEILHRFDPESFEKTLGEGILFQKKARCWELYCEKYPELKTMALEDFFGEEFADAYEKQMHLFSRR